MWEFETEPEFQRELDWIDQFVREEVEPADFIVPNPFDLEDPVRAAVIRAAPAAGQGPRPLGGRTSARSSAGRATAR